MRLTYNEMQRSTTTNNMAASNKNNAAKARKLDHQRQALELRRMGMGYVEIGHHLNISKTHAHRLVKDAMAGAIAQVTADAGDMKAEQLSRLDGMLAGLWPAARKGAVGAVDRVLKIEERRAKLLGLDAPVKHAVGGDKDAPPIQTQHAHELSDDVLAAIAANSGP